MNTAIKKSKVKLLITSEQFKSLIDKVLTEQILSGNKKSIKSSEYGTKR